MPSSTSRNSLAQAVRRVSRSGRTMERKLSKAAQLAAISVIRTLCLPSSNAPGLSSFRIILDRRLGRWRSSAMWGSLVLAVLVFAVAVPEPAGANAGSAASAWAETEHGAVRLIAAVEAVGEGASVPVALQFRMNPGWHIYWRSPGDAGYAPRADWSASTNLRFGRGELAGAKSLLGSRYRDDRLRRRGRPADRGAPAAAGRIAGLARHRGLPDLRRYLRPLCRRARHRSAGRRGAPVRVCP